MIKTPAPATPRRALRPADADRIAARYLFRRLGVDAAGYIKRIAERLAAAGQVEKALAWEAIGDALSERNPARMPPRPDSKGDPAHRAAQCRRLANSIDNMNDPTRAALLRLAEELERAAAAAQPQAADAAADTAAGMGREQR